MTYDMTCDTLYTRTIEKRCREMSLDYGEIDNKSIRTTITNGRETHNMERSGDNGSGRRGGGGGGGGIVIVLEPVSVGILT